MPSAETWSCIGLLCALMSCKSSDLTGKDQQQPVLVITNVSRQMSSTLGR